MMVAPREKGKKGRDDIKQRTQLRLKLGRCGKDSALIYGIWFTR